jgi:hypothetical protein
MRQFLIILLLFSSAPAMAIYKCEAGGKITYSDERCPGGKVVDLSPQGPADTSTAQIAKSLNAQKANANRHPGKLGPMRKEVAEKKPGQSARTALNTAHPEHLSSGM